MKTAIILLLLSLMAPAFSKPATTEQDLVVVTTESTGETSEKSSKEGATPPRISDMEVTSDVKNRFAKTTVKSKVKNEANIPQETIFFVVIPDHAYISSFIMELGGKNYTAYVDEKAKAKATYDEAVSSGYGAAHVAISARDSNKFSVNVNVEPESKAVFYLIYEELLQRKDGHYELVINIHPKQLVKNLGVEVTIEESRPITKITTPPLRSGNEISKKEDSEVTPNSEIIQDKSTPNNAAIKFRPDYEQQKRFAESFNLDKEQGLNGQFVVQYDVQRDPNGGEVLVKDGYFVHFFAPPNLEPLDKHIVFVLDTSGSMYNTKMDQLKTAMNGILGDLNPKDFFNLVEFNTNVKVLNLDAPSESTYFPQVQDSWYVNDEVYDLNDVSFAPAYPINNNTLKKARKAVEEMIPTGGTNIYEALRVALHLIKTRQQRTGDKTTQPLILFLTDGDPTVGKTDTQNIISSIKEQNLAKVPVISLSFGHGADRDFLQKLSLGNNAFARHIYEDSDASLQLKNFYKTISSPLLHDIKFTYAPDVLSLTRNEFPILFGGGELIICGTVTDEGEFMDTPPKVESSGRFGPMDMIPSIQKATGQLERLWAYLTIREYLDAKDATTSNETDYEKKALDLAKKYSFVTPVTSLVVVKPNDTSRAVDAEAADSSGGRLLLSSLPSAPWPSGYGGGQPLHLSSIPSRGGLTTYAVPSFQLGMASSPTAFNSIPPPKSPILHADLDSDFDRISGAGAVDSVDNAQAGVEETIMTTEEEKIIETTTEMLTATLPPNFPLNWLDKHLRPDGTLDFFKGNFRLGFNETSPVDKDCTTPTSSQGLCVLVKDCERIYTELKDSKTFKDYFCAIDDKFAGVCCPKVEK